METYFERDNRANGRQHSNMEGNATWHLSPQLFSMHTYIGGPMVFGIMFDGMIQIMQQVAKNLFEHYTYLKKGAFTSADCEGTCSLFLVLTLIA